MIGRRKTITTAPDAMDQPAAGSVRGVSGGVLQPSSAGCLRPRGSGAVTDDPHHLFPSGVSVRSIQWPQSVTSEAPDRLRWIADYLDLAEKAISVIACAQGLDCPPDLHRGAQTDLRRWARWLEVRPTLAAGFAVARVVPGPDDAERDRKESMPTPLRAE
jgi:hypothetical protein